MFFHVNVGDVMDDTRQPPPGDGKAAGEQMDVEAYAALYYGRTKVQRLIFIAERCGNETMELEALRIAHDDIMKFTDTHLYSEVITKIGDRLGIMYTYDEMWLESVNLRVEQRKEKLEKDLNLFKKDIFKENMRIGYTDLGDFYYDHGFLDDAFKNYVYARDYCTTLKHITEMCMDVILVSIEMGEPMHILNYATKAEQALEHSDPLTVSKLRCASGLAYLDMQKYRLSACMFLETRIELGNNFTFVIAPQDVATYGGLCALASFNRTELKSKVINNINFQYFLGLQPVVRELINEFYSGRYASCLQNLEKLKPNLLLDIHLHDHVESLYTLIRHEAMIQFTHPFVSINMHTMAGIFKTDVDGLVKELEALIMENQIKARIESRNKILYGIHADKRNTTFQDVLNVAAGIERNVRSMLLRINLLKHEANLRSAREL